jgi:DNA-binding XRE family transcriptional regulator
MAKLTKPTSDAVDILHRRFYEGKPSRLKNLEEARANEEIARKIHELRTAAGLTQAQLAKLIGTTASVICRLEDADYEGHSLAMLRRIGAALNQQVQIRFVPIRRSA